MQASVSQRTSSKLPSRPRRILRQHSRSGGSHLLILPSVFTFIAGTPRREAPRNRVEGLIVSLLFQESVLDEVAVLSRDGASFLVIVDQDSQLGVVHMWRRGGYGG